MQKLRHRIAKKADEALNKKPRLFFARYGLPLAAGIILVSIGGMWVSKKECTEPSVISRIVTVCPSKNSPPESCKPHICEKETGFRKEEKCRPASKGDIERMEQEEKKDRRLIFGAVAAFVAFMGGMLLYLKRSIRKDNEKRRKQSQENTGAG
jgi:hypothetical protein